MLELLADPQVWASLLTLTALEIVLGIDNLIFLSIVSGRLPKHQQRLARQLGLALALLGRVALLFSLTWIIGLTAPVVSLFGLDFSWRDIVLIIGGLFLLVKGTMEIHDSVEGRGEEEDIGTKPSAVFGYVIAQIAVIDIVLSFDSVITAVGMVDNRWVMVAAILIAVGVMLFAANPIGDFIDRHPTVKMLALAFIILVGVALIADGFEYHIDRKFLYFAMAFSAGVETLNILAKRKQKRHG